jgi:hypothetical protein
MCFIAMYEHINQNKVLCINNNNNNNNNNSVALVRERTIPTERPPLVGEVSANFLQIEGATWKLLRIVKLNVLSHV